ncbi:MAG TPA: Hsp20/alpha crystallin family protein [Gaiellaceae bacterium]|jgi:HSP20 family protein
MPRDIDRLQSEIEELFSDLWQVPRFMGHRRGFRPAVDVYRSQEPPELRVHVDVAGVEPESIQIVTSGRTLVVAGERSRPPASGTYEQMEIEYGPFQRTIQLPADVETEAATATYTHGVLTIVLPITTQPPSPRQVPIEVREK